MRAAEYVRMSTDYQKYSTANQQAAIREFAAQRGIEVVRTYLDEGRSGLSLRGRPALQALLSDVTKGTREYDAILVYDVSRWGRFQDLDEGAHYEFICRSAGTRVIYCAEQFESDSSPFSGIVKGLRRIMAGEYSRELSEKVFASQVRLVQQGYKVGGAACLGFRRLLLDSRGNPKGLLGYRERKAMQDERVVLIPGPDEELEVVREIFRWFVEERLYYVEIAARLSRAGIAPPPHAKKWTKFMIRRMLSDEKYVGTLVYNRTSGRLSRVRKNLPESDWIRKENALPPIVPLELFKQAVERKRRNPKRYDEVRAELQLKALFVRHGRISASLMRQDGLPDPSVYERRFGSLLDAYQAVGYATKIDYRRISEQAWASRKRRAVHLLPRLISELRVTGARVTREGEYVLRIGDNFRFAFSVLRRNKDSAWRIDTVKDVDANLVVRFAPCSGEDEYFLLPAAMAPGSSLAVSSHLFEKKWGNCRVAREEVHTVLKELCRQTTRPVCHLLPSKEVGI